MKARTLALLVVMAWTCSAHAAIYIKGGPVVGRPGDRFTLWLGNDADGAYVGWLEITDQDVAKFDGDPFYIFDPCIGSCHPLDYFGEWYEFTIASLDPDNPILAGDHVELNILCLAEGETALNLYYDDGATLADSVPITVIPEPGTVVLLGVGALGLRRTQAVTWRTGR